MRYAIFSDVHNHTRALSRMLSDANTRQVDAYLCLGDVGVDPCVELVRNRGAETVFGNWELTNWRGLSPANQQWALNLPPVRHYDGFWISHAAPNWPQQLTSLQKLLQNRKGLHIGSLFPYYLSISNELWQAFGDLAAAQVSVFFHGHTHRQIVWNFTPDNDIKPYPPADFSLVKSHTYIIGVGSVGQPKDGPHAAYLIFDTTEQHIEFIRLSE
jgi:predicted phosphodiesterase